MTAEIQLENKNIGYPLWVFFAFNQWLLNWGKERKKKKKTTNLYSFLHVYFISEAQQEANHRAEGLDGWQGLPGQLLEKPAEMSRVEMQRVISSPDSNHI